MKKIFKRLLCVSLCFLFIILFAFSGFGVKASWFSEEQHVKRITKRLDKKLKEFNVVDYESYQLFPLYDENENLTHFLIEFEPYGFAFIMLQEHSFFNSCIGCGPSLIYKIQTGVDIEKSTWSPYVMDESNSQPQPDVDKKWILDEKGEKIIYNRSPYYVTDNLNERKYLIDAQYGTYIFATKKGENFINLVSGETFKMPLNKGKKYPSIYISFLYLREYNL